MPEPASHPRASYTLPLAKDKAARTVLIEMSGAALDEPIMRSSIKWFCRLRWAVVGMLVAAGLIGNSGTVVAVAGLSHVGHWPFLCAAVLMVANAGFLLHARRGSGALPPVAVRRNLWFQIILDLVVLTVVVHLIGSTTTFIAFAYLFHIVLACIFFPARLSLIVTLLAAGLFILCVLLEQIGLLAPREVFEGASDTPRGKVVFAIGLAMLIWGAVWHLTSHLAATVRRRDAALIATNARLLAAQRERARHMLITTHQLKSPFAAIHAQAQLLADGFCGGLNEQAAAVVQRITARCRRLTREIQEMLQLANLNSRSISEAKPAMIDLSHIVRLCLAELDPIRQDRDIRLELDLGETVVRAVADHLRMLLGNLLSNAITYSRAGGTIRVASGTDASGRAFVTIGDSGIGIEPAKLGRIFDEYYRTNEAVKHNPESSGLGLAIVKQIALLHGIQVRVESQVGSGTTFHLVFPVERPVRE
ncbi:MAG: HAMP domain-containing histidine kinase [Planctomycetes bacterium]|nr:HAMP domain-containing histidine kinase [Planctomycetota bacterium]